MSELNRFGRVDSINRKVFFPGTTPTSSHLLAFWGLAQCLAASSVHPCFSEVSTVHIRVPSRWPVDDDWCTHAGSASPRRCTPGFAMLRGMTSRPLRTVSGGSWAIAGSARSPRSGSAGECSRASINCSRRFGLTSASTTTTPSCLAGR